MNYSKKRQLQRESAKRGEEAKAKIEKVEKVEKKVEKVSKKKVSKKKAGK